MTQLSTITQLTRLYGVSPRTLRYYESIGLIASVRPDGYAYRTYDERNCARIGQIVLLRKLRIPVRQIAELLQSGDAMHAVDVFQGHVRELGAQIGALETLRGILSALIEQLRHATGVRFADRLLSDDTIRALIESVPGDAPKLRNGFLAESADGDRFFESAPPTKEDITMSELNQAGETLGKLTDVRIVYLPPATVAASHFIGDEPENVAGDRIDAFAKAVGIVSLKPDVRLYGFNHPNPVDETNAHGYEFWLTIPDDLDVPTPLAKKRFEGGLFAAHMIRMGDFQEWAWLDTWVRTNGEYTYRGDGSPENMFGSLEEHLNAYTHFKAGGMNAEFVQLDLLIPVRKK